MLKGAKCTTEASRMTVLSGNPSSSSQLHALLNFLLSEELAHLQPFLLPVWKIPEWDQPEQFKYSLKWQLSSNLSHKWSSQQSPPTHTHKKRMLYSKPEEGSLSISSHLHHTDTAKCFWRIRWQFPFFFQSSSGSTRYFTEPQILPPSYEVGTKFQMKEILRIVL